MSIETVYILKSLFAVGTPHCFHICIHVIALRMYTNAIKTQNTLIEQCISTYFSTQMWAQEDLQSSVNIVYVSIFVNYNVGSDKM